MMDRSSNSSEQGLAKDTTARDQCLKHLNRISHRISKPATRRPPLGHHHQPPPPPAVPLPSPPPQNLQPPVYNINKNEFRDVVQKLTGSPAHERSSSNSPPVHAPKPKSSRLQRIRPPPLSAITTHPPAAAPPPSNFRHVSPPSPLPPFPSPHCAAVESPISAHMMRYYQCQGSTATTDFDPSHLSRPLNISPTSTARSSCPLLSSGQLFSPTAGQLLPYIPPVPSPRWRDV